jgi:hypothetical protein
MIFRERRVFDFFWRITLEGIGAALAAGSVGDFYFAFTYAHWRATKFWTATWMTMASHAIQN